MAEGLRHVSQSLTQRVHRSAACHASKPPTHAQGGRPPATWPSAQALKGANRSCTLWSIHSERCGQRHHNGSAAAPQDG